MKPNFRRFNFSMKPNFRIRFDFSINTVLEDSQFNSTPGSEIKRSLCEEVSQFFINTHMYAHKFQKIGYSGIIPFMHVGKNRYISTCNMKSLWAG